VRSLIAVLVVAGCVAGCIEPGSHRCGSELCPPNKTCTADGLLCVYVEQIAACQGKSDGTMCMYSGVTNGVCQDGACLAAVCGDGIVEPGEVCDGAATSPSGMCAPNCQSDLTCGNGVVDPDEVCDCGRDAATQPKKCAAINGDDPLATCTSTCTLHGCGDDLVRTPEQCDGVDLQGEDCTSRGFYGGTLSCSPDTCLYDTSKCVGTCGDGKINGTEQCDLPDLGGKDCTAFGFHEAAGLSCSQGCTWDLSKCTGACGDDQVSSPELCDGSAPATSCVDLGWDSGVIGCTGACGPDIDDCRRAGFTTEVSGTTNELTGVWGDYAVGGWLYQRSGASWTHVVLPAMGGSGVWAVWGSARTDVWAVGGGAFDHWDGASWADQTPAGEYLPINAISGRSSSDVVAVGASGTIYQYDGTSWTQVTGITTQTLRGAWVGSTGEAYAVGDAGTILHRQSGVWTASTSGVTSFFGVWGDATDVFIAGTTGLLQRSGASWNAVTLPGGAQILDDVWGLSPTDIYAAGYAGQILHFDGATWSALSSPTTQPLERLGGSAGDVLAVGGGGEIVHYDEVTWTPTTNTTNLTGGVWGSGPGDVFAVGPYGTIRHLSSGTAWTTMTSNSNAVLWGVWGSGPKNVFAVGGGGTIDQYDGTSWTPQTVGTADLYAVWGSSATDVFAVGSGGTIIHRTTGAWSAMTSNVTDNLNAVWGTGPTDVFAVGDQGRILHYDGTGWSLAPFFGNAPLYAVSGLPGGDVFVAGKYGRLHRWDGTSWAAISSGTTQDLHALWVGGPADAYAVGSGGAMVHDDGLGWSPVVAQVGGTDLRAIWGSAPQQPIYVVGATSVTRIDRGAMTCGAAESSCDDHFDNDCDGLADACDPDCAGTVAEQCANGRDDDCDGLTDCADPDCSGLPACQGGGLCRAAVPVTCGSMWNGDTSLGAPPEIEYAPCDPLVESGPQVFARFDATASQTVIANVYNVLGNYLDLVVVGTASTGACDPWAQCIGSSSLAGAFARVTFDAVAGQTYYFAIGGTAQTATFTLDMICQ
jgi:hypothetical protein